MQAITVIWDVTEAERWSVLNALRTATDTYRQTAVGFRDLADSIGDGNEHPMFATGDAGVAAATALAAQFDSQVEECERLYAAIENAPRIVVCESDED